MATLYKRSNGRYYAQFFDSTKHPSLKQVSLKTTRIREAEKRLLELEEAGFCPWIEKQGETKQDMNRLGIAVKLFMRSRSNLRPETLRRYRTVLGLMQEHLGAELPCSQITATHLHSFLDSTNTKPVTKQSYTRAMKTFFNWLIEREVLEKNPAKKVRLERVPQKHPRYLTPADVEAICRAIESNDERAKVTPGTSRWLLPIVQSNVYLGLRAGEVCNLRWDDVDLERRTLKVVNSEDFTTKSGKERMLPLSEPVMVVLARLDKRTNWVFPNHGGSQLHKQYLSRQFKHFVRLAGLPEFINFHTTRHTACSWLAQRVVPVEAIRRYAGHSSITVTERYMHLADDVYAEKITAALSA